MVVTPYITGTESLGPMTRPHFSTPVFQLAAISARERIVYAPLRRLAFTVNEAGAQAIEAIRFNRLDARVPDQFLERLEGLGLFEDLPDAPPPLPSDAGAYLPTKVTLFVTGRCNLRCTYCYANGGENHSMMPWQIARAALDFVIENALTTGQKRVTVIFHGDGEPTLGWPLIERAIRYTEDRCECVGVSSSFEAGLNGIVSESHARWLAHKLSNITVSVDGPPDIQDKQRPLASDGQASSTLVERTLAILDDAGAKYGIRCTITRLSAGRIPEVVEYLCGVSRARMLMIEPAFVAGRALASGEPSLDPGVFIHGFLSARLIARRYGRRLLFSGARADQVTNRFCGASSGAFNVTEDGRITACYEVCSQKDHRISLFEIGGYVGPDRGFWVNEAKLSNTARWAASNKPACQSCFAKYHCAGDCPAKLAMNGDPCMIVDPARCYLIREITRAQIFSLYGLGDVVEPSEEWRTPVSAVGSLVQIQSAPAAGSEG